MNDETKAELTDAAKKSWATVRAALLDFFTETVPGAIDTALHFNDVRAQLLAEGNESGADQCLTGIRLLVDTGALKAKHDAKAQSLKILMLFLGAVGGGIGTLVGKGIGGIVK